MDGVDGTHQHSRPGQHGGDDFNGPGGIRALDLDGIRALRRESQREESDLSYLRRLLQGRIDILRAELNRRTGGLGACLVDRLPEILAEQNRGSARGARYVTVNPPRTGMYAQRIEQLLGDVELSDPAARSETELAAALDRLTAYEQEVSDRRRRLQHTADDCATEIARRYREGEAKVEDLLSGR